MRALIEAIKKRGGQRRPRGAPPAPATRRGRPGESDSVSLGVPAVRFPRHRLCALNTRAFWYTTAGHESSLGALVHGAVTACVPLRGDA